MNRPQVRSLTRRSASLSDEAYARLEELIITLQLPPGTAVSEASLSELIEIGRTPVREALQRLVREGLIVVMPQRGTLVSEVDVAMLLRLLEVRRELERLISRLAARRASATERMEFLALANQFALAAGARGVRDAQAFMRADSEFNLLCLQASRNEFAAGSMSLMHGLCRRFFYLHTGEPAVLHDSAKAHAELARAIAAGDESAAAAALDRVMDCTEKIARITLSEDF